MKKIHDILSGIGITVPEDKKKDFETAFNENYKTVTGVEKITSVKRLKGIPHFEIGGVYRLNQCFPKRF